MMVRLLSFIFLLLVVPAFGQQAPSYFAPMVPSSNGAMMAPGYAGPMINGVGPMIPNTTLGGAASGPPTVTAVNPGGGSTVGGTAVVISGTNFQGVTIVDFGANPASFSYVSPTQINATSPAGSAGTIHVTVTTPLGTSSTSAADQFTYSACTNKLDFTQACNSQYIVAIGF